MCLCVTVNVSESVCEIEGKGGWEGLCLLSWGAAPMYQRRCISYLSSLPLGPQ